MNLFTRASQFIMLAMVAALTIAIMGCDGDGGETPEAASPAGGMTPTVTAGAEATVEPSPEEVVCAAESTDRFVDAQDQVSWTVYCPSFLPEGFELEELTVYFPEVAADAGGPRSDEPQGSVDARFVNQQGASVGLHQGDLAAAGIAGVDLIPRVAAGEGISPETTAFGELDGTLYAPLTTIQGVDVAAYVVVVPAEGPPPSYVLQTSEVDVDAVRQIAAGMRPVSPTQAPEAGGDEADEYAGWLTYTNDVYGYEINYPPEAGITEARQQDFGLSPEQSAAGVTFEDLFRTYTGKVCVHLAYDLGYVLISAPPNEEDLTGVLCFRTGRAYEGPARQETLIIDGATYTARGFEEQGPGETLSYHNEMLFVSLEDGTRIEYGSTVSRTATFEDYLQIRDVLLRIVQSYRELPLGGDRQ